jgi:hypothetical protein
MAKHSYTSKKWCTSATKLIYKPNKAEPHNISSHRSIVLINCIITLWTSILTNIITHTAKAEGIFSDTADIYDSLSTHIMMYKGAQLSKKAIYIA